MSEEWSPPLQTLSEPEDSNFEMLHSLQNEFLREQINHEAMMSTNVFGFQAMDRENREIQERFTQIDFNIFQQDLQSAVSTNTPELNYSLPETTNNLSSLTQGDNTPFQSAGSIGQQKLSLGKKLGLLTKIRQLRKCRRTLKEKMRRLEEENRSLREKMERCECGVGFAMAAGKFRGRGSSH